MTYIVHGATGAQGSPVVSALLAAGHAVRAAVRDTSKVDGVDAVQVDSSSVESLAAAYEGAEGVFVHLPLGHPDAQREQALAIGAAIKKVKPGRVVFSTSGYTVDVEVDNQDAPNVMARELAASGVSYAIVAPRLYLENLLLPPVQAAAQQGVLPYPLREDYATSWSSHLDVADVVVRLLTTTEVSGVVDVGVLPGLLGSDLAEGFSEYLGTSVRYRAIATDEFGGMIRPLFGEDATAPVVAGYEYRHGQPGDEIRQARSAQSLLGVQPRSVVEWLRAMGV